MLKLRSMASATDSGKVRLGEGRERLGSAVLEHREVVAAQAGDRVARLVHDRRVDLDQVDAGA